MSIDNSNRINLVMRAFGIAILVFVRKFEDEIQSISTIEQKPIDCNFALIPLCT